jgi:hypothetical protein
VRLVIWTRVLTKALHGEGAGITKVVFLKPAAGDIFVKTKQLLGLTGAGNTAQAFARATLAPLIREGMAVYSALRADIFVV